MSTGGYKCVKFSWQGGRSDTPVDRVKFILNGVCDAIIGANVGWQLDTLTPTSSDFLTMPSSDASYYPNFAKILTLTHNNHVYKLGLGYIYFVGGPTTIQMKPSDCVNCRRSNSFNENGNLGSGLYFCLIKDGSLVQDQTYGYIWDGNGEFLRWTPGCSIGENSSSYSYSFAYEDNASYIYSYYFLLKNMQIVIFSKSSNWSSVSYKCTMLGEIFKETAHTDDLITLGAFSLSTNDYAEANPPSYGSYYYGICCTSGYYSSLGYSESTQSQILTSNGSFSKSTNGNSIYYQIRFTLDTVVATNAVSGNRWTPIGVYISATDHDTYGVVPGDGFKGYIDTDLLRGVNPNYSYGQQLQGGDFVYLGGGFAIGWDADNEILLF